MERDNHSFRKFRIPKEEANEEEVVDEGGDDDDIEEMMDKDVIEDDDFIDEAQVIDDAEYIHIYIYIYIYGIYSLEDKKILEATFPADEFVLEVERVAHKLKIHIGSDSKEWRAHLEQTKRYSDV